mmetsp:Transcript_306/g.696  ORF Transcript_306/g.696 Transcript_306/m.696 type:complete len:287 (-) Transcript_306:2617-3477(-)
MSEVADSVTQLLSKHGILNYRTLFCQEQYSKSTMPQSNDHIIKPFTLTIQEKSLAPELADIAQSNFHSRITLADERLKQVLSLETLKKKVVYHAQLPPNSSIVHKKSAAPQSKGGEKRRRRSQNTSVSVDEIFDDTFQKKRGRVSDRSSKKPDGHVTDVSVVSRIPQDVLQPKLEAVFQVFWDLELEPSAVVTPFFGLITPRNCDMLGLPRFFDKVVESCSLANISEKLKEKAYVTVESFEADFNLMFNNIYLYFAPDSLQYLKAKELHDLFRERWTHVLMDLKKL